MALLVAETHGVLLRLLSKHLGQHQSGLAQGVRGARVTGRLKKRLLALETAHNVLRHITEPFCVQLAREVEEFFHANESTQANLATVSLAEQVGVQSSTSSPECELNLTTNTWASVAQEDPVEMTTMDDLVAHMGHDIGQEMFGQSLPPVHAKEVLRELGVEDDMDDEPTSRQTMRTTSLNGIAQRETSQQLVNLPARQQRVVKVVRFADELQVEDATFPHSCDAGIDYVTEYDADCALNRLPVADGHFLDACLCQYLQGRSHRAPRDFAYVMDFHAREALLRLQLLQYDLPFLCDAASALLQRHLATSGRSLGKAVIDAIHDYAPLVRNVT
mmetsp:Transcript_20021/g.36133  ORF Transcript_20021/g.36133 Transcript_20021/m.36133 type:complete len:332 (-) Transcript_20021:155-1150(-)